MWLRNNLSTIACNCIENYFFNTLAFIGIFPMSVIISRALPDVRDGLKPVHRRILYTMWENGLLPDRPHHKCADTVGKTLSDYHPQKDTSVYGALNL